jgi:hypothetical protein
LHTLLRLQWASTRRTCWNNYHLFIRPPSVVRINRRGRGRRRWRRQPRQHNDGFYYISFLLQCATLVLHCTYYDTYTTRVQLLMCICSMYIIIIYNIHARACIHTHTHTHTPHALIVNSWEKFRAPSRILLKIEPNFISVLTRTTLMRCRNNYNKNF